MEVESMNYMDNDDVRKKVFFHQLTNISGFKTQE